MLSVAPIVLNNWGDKLIIPPEIIAGEKEIPKDFAGTHEVCGGKFTFRKTSDRAKTLLCSRCFLRLTVSDIIQSYDALRRNIAQQGGHQ